MRFTVDYPPTLNNLYATVRGRRVLSEAGKAYKHTAGWQARAAGVSALNGSVIVSAWIYRPRMAGDIDNVFKALLDALSGICWTDDSQIVELHAYRFDDKHNPRVEVEIKEAES